MSDQPPRSGGARRTVAVTGGSGFIGSAVVSLAVSQGHRVASLVRECEPAPEIGSVEHHVVEWSDRSGLAATLARVAPASVIHCAGSTGRSGEDVSALYRANVQTVWDLLGAVRSVCPEVGVVLLSTAAVYGVDPEVPTAEDAPLAPATHYASSKAMAEELSRTFASVDGIRCVAARPFNVYGPGEPPGSVTSRVLEQFESASGGSRITVRLRESASVRDLIDVDDVASALLLLAERGAAGVAYNVCTGRGVSVSELVQAVAEVEDSDYCLTVDDPSAAGTVSIGRPDALTSLGWRPRHDLQGSLRRVLAGGAPRPRDRPAHGRCADSSRSVDSGVSTLQAPDPVR
jgi:nucleoside-diphosphate-sugar epimerase